MVLPYRIRIRAFRAIDEKETCYRFAEGHRKVLELYGVTRVTSANLDWVDNPFVYVIVAENIINQDLVGGARIHVYDENYPLPMEKAISVVDSSIHEKIKKYSLGGTGEICGLWNSKEVAGVGIGTLFLMRAGITIVDQLQLSSLLALCAEHTLWCTLSKGFIVDKSLGKDGTYYYPKEDLIATAVKIIDPYTLQYAEIEEREVIFQLRNNPDQTRTDYGSKGAIEMNYQLKLNITKSI